MSQRNQTLAAALTEVLGDRVAGLTDALGELTAEVRARDLRATMTMLRDREALRFEQLLDVCGVDYSTFTGHGAGAADEGIDTAADTGAAGDGAAAPTLNVRSRFACVYHLLSLTHNQRLRVRVFVPDDAFPVVESVVDVWPSANWFEREAFDLYGVMFTGHPDLRRILTDYGFVGHPFRKDFPISGHVEMRFDPQQGRVIYQPVTIEPREIVPRIVREDAYADDPGFAKG